MARTPDHMPVLSRGKHRNARKGACFMEFASYLAGERWSDHPACTHPLLAAMARGVNDLLDDESRPRIVWLIPDVVGLDTDDPRAHAWIAREAALAALPVVPEARQRVAAVGLLHCERHLAGLGEPSVDPRTRRALDDAPHARDWAREFVKLGSHRRAQLRQAERTGDRGVGPGRDLRVDGPPQRHPGRAARAHDRALPRAVRHRHRRDGGSARAGPGLGRARRPSPRRWWPRSRRGDRAGAAGRG